ncbi:MAG: endonuclease/exonuclease/phosphatase family protein, partial [Candidatus Promineifilaceae bacterium]
PEGPVYTGDYADLQPEFDGTVSVVTWNIKFGIEIEEAIKEWGDSTEVKLADIVLLQEMDKDGVEFMAKELGYNYVYYPASIHDRHNLTFGNAVLSKWPILDYAKIVLPYQSPSNDQRRIAVRAAIQMGEDEMLAYSVHTETVVLGAKKRAEQFDALIQDINEQPQEYVVVGGDFNTYSQKASDNLESKMAAAGLEHVSPDNGPTFRWIGGLGFTLDHLFVKNFTTLESGVWHDTEASDHVPVWAVLTPNPSP